MKDFILGVAIAGIGGVIAYWLIKSFSAQPQTAPAATIGIGTPPPWSEIPAVAPAGHFWDPMVSRLVAHPEANAVTFAGSGGTFQSEARPSGTKYT